MEILKKVEAYRTKQENLKWEGTFKEYLDLLKEKPYLAQSAHSRIYEMIIEKGVEEVEVD